MKSLNDIEKKYCNEIVEFFSREYSSISHINQDRKIFGEEKVSEEMNILISRQIETRLLDTRLIRNFRVEVNIHPKSEKRDVSIDNILENRNDAVVDNVIVLLEYKDLTKVSLEHIIDDVEYTNSYAFDIG